EAGDEDDNDEEKDFEFETRRHRERQSAKGKVTLQSAKLPSVPEVGVIPLARGLNHEDCPLLLSFAS
ncbi:MAG TPA: hypothetical protein VMG34_14250, partial [Bacteroidota bacterium]|nr:hypothetical protein [Bacteroidota bacterium]